MLRAASGGLLFGVPLLFTMEVWWVGTHTDPTQMAGILGLLVVPVALLNKTDGFRTSKDVRWSAALADTVEAIAIGLVVTAAILIVLRELTLETPLAAWLGKVLYESVPFCLGIAVARHFFHGERVAEDDDSSSEGLSDDLADLGATTIGAAFIALSIAPTDEVPMIASAMRPAWLLVVIGASLLISYAVVFSAGFSSQEDRLAQHGPFQHPLTETIVCYLVALVVSASLLWLFQRGIEPLDDLLARVVVLGLPASIGGAAGRLAL